MKLRAAQLIKPFENSVYAEGLTVDRPGTYSSNREKRLSELGIALILERDDYISRVNLSFTNLRMDGNSFVEQYRNFVTDNGIVDYSFSLERTKLSFKKETTHYADPFGLHKDRLWAHDPRLFPNDLIRMEDHRIVNKELSGEESVDLARTLKVAAQQNEVKLTGLSIHEEVGSWIHHTHTNDSGTAGWIDVGLPENISHDRFLFGLLAQPVYLASLYNEKYPLAEDEKRAITLTQLRETHVLATPEQRQIFSELVFYHPKEEPTLPPQSRR